MKDQRYYTGEEIHIGDRVTFGGCPSTIVLVVDRDEFPPSESYASRTWWRTAHGSGFLIRQENGADIFLDGPDEDLLFLDRANSTSGPS